MSRKLTTAHLKKAFDNLGEIGRIASQMRRDDPSLTVEESREKARKVFFAQKRQK